MIIHVAVFFLLLLLFFLFLFSVAGSIVLTFSNYDAYESNGSVSVCTAINVAALERRIIVQLSSQDSTANSMFTDFM